MNAMSRLKRRKRAGCDPIVVKWALNERHESLFIGAQMLYIGLSLQWGVGIFNRQMWVAAFFFSPQEGGDIYINTLFPVSNIQPWRKIKPHSFI